jgi:hypothetical protein
MVCADDDDDMTTTMMMMMMMLLQTSDCIYSLVYLQRWSGFCPLSVVCRRFWFGSRKRDTAAEQRTSHATADVCATIGNGTQVTYPQF